MTDKILLVEDEEKLARMVELELKYEGYQVDKAADGRTGLDMAQTGDYDLILLDIMLPALSGMEVLRRLRREQLARLEKYTRRFRKHYAKMTVSASRYRPTMEDLRAAGALALEELQKKKEQLQAARRRNK